MAAASDPLEQAPPAPDEVPWHGVAEEEIPEEKPAEEPPEEPDPELEFATRWQDRLIPGTVPVPFLRKRGRLPGWLRLVLVVLFLALLIVPAWVFARWLLAPSLRTERWLLPDHCEWLVVVDVAQLRQSESIYWGVLKAAPPAVAASIHDFPVPADNIARLILARTADGTGLSIVRTREPMRPAQLRQRIKADSLRREEIGRYMAYTDARGQSLCQVQSDLVLIGQLPTLKRVLTRAGAPQVSPEMDAAIDALDLRHTLLVVAAPGQPLGSGPDSVEVSSLLIQADVAEQLDADFVVDCAGPEQAEALGKLLRETLARELPRTSLFVGNWEVATSGARVHGQVRLDADTLIATMRRALGLRLP